MAATLSHKCQAIIVLYTVAPRRYRRESDKFDVLIWAVFTGFTREVSDGYSVFTFLSCFIYFKVTQVFQPQM